MDRITIDTTLSPIIIIDKVEGNLRIKGWDRAEIKADSTKQDTLHVEKENNDVRINCKSGVILRVPLDSSLQIGEVHGELMLKSLENDLEINIVHGQILGKSIGAITAGTVHGNMNIKYIEGNAICQVVEGNLGIQDVEGTISIGQCSGNLDIQGYASAIEAKTKGNATLNLSPKTNGTFTVTANGNIECSLPSDISANFHLQSDSQIIQIDGFGYSEEIQAKEHQFEIGDGKNSFQLKATGNIAINSASEKTYKFGFTFDFDEDLSTLADDISQVVNEQIEVQMGAITKQINELTMQIPSNQLEEKTMRKLEARRRSLEKKMDRLDKKTYRAKYKYRQPKTAPGNPVSSEERQKVLEMLQNQLISVDEAETLLAALEGREAKTSGN